MAIGDAGLGKMGRERVLGEALLARDRCCADVEDLLDAGIFEGADEAGDGPALIADGADRFWRHVESLLPSPRWSGASKSQTLRGPPAFCLAGQEANGSVGRCGLAATSLYAGRSQAGQAVLINGPLPAQELIDGEGVALAGFLEADQAAADRGDDLGLAANDPPFGIPGRQIGDCKRTAVGADHISDAWPKMISHGLSWTQHHHRLKASQDALFGGTKDQH